MYTTENALTHRFEAIVTDISITDDFAAAIKSALRQNHAALKAKMKREEAAFLAGLTDLEAHEDRLYTDLRAGLIDDAMYRRQLERVRSERRRLSHLLLELQASLSDSYLTAAEATLELAKSAESQWKQKAKAERAELLRKLLWNPRVTGQTIEYEWRKPFAVLIKMKQEREWGG